MARLGQGVIMCLIVPIYRQKFSVWGICYDCFCFVFPPVAQSLATDHANTRDRKAEQGIESYLVRRGIAPSPSQSGSGKDEKGVLDVVGSKDSDLMRRVRSNTLYLV